MSIQLKWTPVSIVNTLHRKQGEAGGAGANAQDNWHEGQKCTCSGVMRAYEQARM